MEILVFFAIIILIFLRCIGLVVSIDFFLITRKSLFKFLIVGWIFLIITGFLPLLAEITENLFLSEILLLLNGLLASLGALFITVGIIAYFEPIPVKIAYFFSIATIVIPISIFIFYGLHVAINIALLILFCFLFGFLTKQMLGKNRLKTFVGKNIKWWYATALFVYVYIPILIVIHYINNLSFGLYQSTSAFLLIINYFFGIAVMVFLIVLIIHLEYVISDKQKYELKDKYSHDIGNILQVIYTATDISKFEDKFQNDVLLEIKDLVQDKVKEASDLIKEIREL